MLLPWVRDEESAQLMVTKGMACSFGMPLAPMALERMREKINQITQKVLALLQLNTNRVFHTRCRRRSCRLSHFVGGFYDDD
jgi:hypothetical protein